MGAGQLAPFFSEGVNFMGRCICERTCFVNGRGLCIAGLTNRDKQPVEYDVDPTASYAIHFKFFHPDDERTRLANRLIQDKRNLENSIKILTEPKDIEKARNQLVQVRNQLKDVPNSFKEKFEKEPAAAPLGATA
jgi:hypothetical protein